MNIARKARALALIATAVSAPAIYGQAIYGSLYGTVTDASGAAIPNATVVVTDVAKGTSDTVTTNASGAYTVEHLIPDSYSIKVTAQGFSTFQTTGITVSADTSPKVDAKLNVGDTGQTVTVQADDIPLLKTDRADVSNIFDQKNVTELPLPNRNFTGLQLLLPGAQLLGWSHAASENPQGSQQIVVDGQFFAGTGYELDGTDNQDPILGIIVVNPTLDSVAEAKITTQNYDAQFGKAVSSVVATQTKSGGNSVHGGVYDYRQSDAFQAKNPFNSPDVNTGRTVPANLRNQFGAFIGGPIQKDRFFYFFDYEGVRSKVGTSNGLSTVPTANLRNSCATGACNFSDYADFIGKDANGNYYGIWNPATGQQYPNFTIPAAQINPVALRLLQQLPAPILSGPVSNFPNSGTGKFNFNQYITRVDMQLNDRVHAFGRYAYFGDTLQGGTAFGALGGIGFGTGGFGGTSKGLNQSWSVGTDIVVSPKWVTDVRFGFLRYTINTQKYDGNEAFAANNGQPGLNISTFANTGGAPEFDINGLPNNSQGQGGGNFGSGLGVNRCNCPLTQNERQYQWVNNWTHELGNHSIKFGVDLRHAYNLRVPSDANRAGVLGFNAGQTASTSGTGGLAYASFLLGRVGTFSRYASTSNNASETQNRFFGYIQDTWRITPKLTFNYGLRWENYLPEKLGQDLGSLLNLNTGNLQVAHEGPYGGDMGISNNNKAFAPRIGIAYSMNAKTVIRAGYGRSYDIGVFGSIFGHAASQNLPVLAKQNVTSSNSSYAFILGNTPPLPNFGGAIVNGNIRLPDGINANARPTTERFPTIDAWNAQIQRDLGHQYSLTLGYVGNKGTHTSMGGGYTSNPNQVAVAANGLVYNPGGVNANGNPVFQPAPNSICIGAPSPNLPCSGAGDPRRRPYYSRYGWTQDINYFSSEGDTTYESFQTTLEKRFSQGYQFKVNYAYQVATDHDSNYIDIDRTLNYGNSPFLRRSQLTFFGNLELPFGRNHAFLNQANRLEELVFGGWQISPTANLASGLPYDVTFNGAGANVDAGSSRPNYNGGFKTGLGQFVLTPTAKYRTFFSQQTVGSTGSVFTNPGYLKFGNLSRYAFFGPNFYNLDVAAQKNFHFTERFSGQFRTDFFNVLNIQNFDLPQTTIDASNAGQITGLAPGSNPRYLQFAVKLLF